MPKTKISEFSATPGNNTDIDGINIAEGCAPSGINDAIRELMAQLKDFQAGTAGDSFNGPVGTSTAAAGAFTTLSATGVATFSSGTAGAPAITTTGDTNTGLFFPAADTVAASVGGTEGLRLTSTGLGVGTSSWSTSKLYVLGNTTNYAITSEAPNGYAALNLKQTSGNTMSLGMASNGLFIYDNNAGTTRLTLDSSGNLGLGVTPSAWNSGAKALQISSTSSFYGTSNATLIGQNTFNNTSGNNIYLTTAAASLYQQFGGSHSWYTAASGTAGNTISFTQAMTLDASGRLGVGTTSPGDRLTLASSAGNGAAATFWANGGNSSNELYIGQGGSNEAYVFNRANQYLVFGTNNTERARITSGGDLLVGTTSGSSTERLKVQKSVSDWYLAVLDNSSTGNPYGLLLSYSGRSGLSTVNEMYIRCQDSTATRMYVMSNGGIANYSGNNSNLSDRREKTNFAPAKDYLDTICAIPVQTFNYIDQSEDDPGTTLGVVAQDVQAVAPELVMESNWGTKDDPKMRLSIYQTDLQYALMKALQELNAKVESLTTELNALKGT